MSKCEVALWSYSTFHRINRLLISQRSGFLEIASRGIAMVWPSSALGWLQSPMLELQWMFVAFVHNVSLWLSDKGSVEVYHYATYGCLYACLLHISVELSLKTWQQACVLWECLESHVWVVELLQCSFVRRPLCVCMCTCRYLVSAMLNIVTFPYVCLFV